MTAPRDFGEEKNVINMINLVDLLSVSKLELFYMVVVEMALFWRRRDIHPSPRLRLYLNASVPL
ncbi:hypothetical protein PoB_001357900 [Plakobranchus ocellatus]|uniref:Uncharacterized protein n=1 Tax=Plakobranchus ocellatus TaxID=259542 RepID=A0AAV3YVH7_9GAST|nr:hypothetical protein PoB_001357900 [Plakobranchus ocellatus]